MIKRNQEGELKCPRKGKQRDGRVDDPCLLSRFPSSSQRKFHHGPSYPYPRLGNGCYVGREIYYGDGSCSFNGRGEESENEDIKEGDLGIFAPYLNVS